MFRTILAVTFISLAAGPAFAEAPAASNDDNTKVERVEYRSTWQRLQGAPYARAEQRRIAAHPTQSASAGEAAMERIPEANYLLEGRFGFGTGIGSGF